DRDCTAVASALDAVPYGIFDQRLDRKRRDDRRPGLGWDREADVEAISEASLLEAQVALDVGELIGDGHVRAAVAEQVARELGEVDQQLPRLLGPGVGVPGQGGERVVDEVRADRRTWGSQPGLGEPLLLFAHHGQLELRRD